MDETKNYHCSHQLLLEVQRREEKNINRAKVNFTQSMQRIMLFCHLRKDSLATGEPSPQFHFHQASVTGKSFNSQQLLHNLFNAVTHC